MKDKFKKIICSFIEKKERDNIRFISIKKESDVCMAKMKYLYECISEKDIEKMSKLDIFGEDFSGIVVNNYKLSKNELLKAQSAANFQLGRFNKFDYSNIVNIYLKAMDQITKKLNIEYNKYSHMLKKYTAEKAALSEQMTNAVLAIQILENGVKDRPITSEDLMLLKKCLEENKIMTEVETYEFIKDIISNNMEIVKGSNKVEISDEMKLLVEKINNEVKNLGEVPEQIKLTIVNLAKLSLEEKYNEYNKIDNLAKRYIIMLWDLKSNIMSNLSLVSEEELTKYYEQLKRLEDDAFMYRVDEQSTREEEYKEKDIKDYSVLISSGYEELADKMKKLDSQTIELLNYADTTDKSYISEEIVTMVKELMELKKEIIFSVNDYNNYYESYDKLKVVELSRKFQSVYERMMNYEILTTKEEKVESISNYEQAIEYFKDKSNIVLFLGDGEKSYIEHDDDESKLDLINSSFIKKIDYIGLNSDVISDNNKAKSSIPSEDAMKKYRIKILPCGSKDLFYTRIPSNLGLFLNKSEDPTVLLVYGICDTSSTGSVAAASDDAYRRAIKDGKKIDHIMDLLSKDVDELSSNEKKEIVNLITNSYNTLENVKKTNVKR